MNPMAGKRSYGDPCGIARALDVVGERWALLVVRELVLGPKRFTDLRAHLPGIATDVLSQRLRQLEQAGVLRPVAMAAPASGRVYELTARGRELEPVLHALGRWGSHEGLEGVTHDLSVERLHRGALDGVRPHPSPRGRTPPSLWWSTATPSSPTCTTTCSRSAAEQPNSPMLASRAR